MNLLSRLDALIARTRPLWRWLGQLALMAVGVHLAADHLDDALGDWIRMVPLSWPDPETPSQVATWGALLAELLGVAWSGWALARAHGAPVASVREWTRRASVHAITAPLAWLPLALAGSWGLAMATEDAVSAWLPSAPPQLATGAGWVMAALVVWRLALPGLVALTRCTPEPRSRQEGLLWAPLLALLCAFAWRYGVPVWGLLGVAG